MDVLGSQCRPLQRSLRTMHNTTGICTRDMESMTLLVSCIFLSSAIEFKDPFVRLPLDPFVLVTFDL